MPHARTTIRGLIDTALQALVPAVITVVRDMNGFPVGENELPAVIFKDFVEDDLQAMDVMGVPADGTFRRLRQDMTIEVKQSTEAPTSLNDTLDAIALEVEKAIRGDASIETQTHGIRLLKTSSSHSGGEGDQPSGRLTLVWDVIYRTNPEDPGSLMA